MAAGDARDVVVALSNAPANEIPHIFVTAS